MFVFILVLLAAIVFEYINGFHDAANAIATVVSTKVLSPRQAILMAVFFNMLGAMLGTAVAATVGKGIVDTRVVTMGTVFSALIGAIVWNLVTWWLGLPSSSSHALVGGLCGAALAKPHGDWSVLKWSIFNPVNHTVDGIWPKVVLPMMVSPLLGFIGGAVLMFLLLFLLRHRRPMMVQRVFGKLQLVSASWMGLSHGSNDAQKTMGIIALALYTGTRRGTFDHLPAALQFLRMETFAVPMWVVVLCALTMAAGTAGGGWRIIRTLGHRMVKLQPVHGFAAETTAAAIIQTASHFGIPLSTTHVIATSIMGVGTAKRFSAVKWGIVQQIVWAWVFTLPTSALISYLCGNFIQMMHFHP
jgi:PiT family inorganic phosphate transporter